MTPCLYLLCHEAVQKPTYQAVQRELTSLGIHWMHDIGGDSAVDRARSTIMTDFVRRPIGDVMLMIDDDVAWQPTDALYLATKAYDLDAVVGGLVPKRAVRKGYGCRLVDGKPHEIGSDELVELDDNAYVGGAMMAVPRTVLQSMLAKCEVYVHGAGLQPMSEVLLQGWNPFAMPVLVKNDLLGGRTDYLSEDWAICHRAREAGHRVFLAMRTLVNHRGFGPLEANHAGPMGLTYDDTRSESEAA